jgi:hypothetical protein
MAKRTPDKSAQRRARTRAIRSGKPKSRSRFPLLALALLALVVAGVAGFLLTRGDGAGRSPSAPASADAAWSATAYQGGARLAVDRTLIDAGSVAYEQPVNASFTLKNVGDKPLALQKPKVSTLEGC